MDRKFFKKIGYVLFGGIMALTSCVNNGGQVLVNCLPGCSWLQVRLLRRGRLSLMKV